MATKIRAPAILLLFFLGGSEVLLAQLCALGPAADGRRSVTASVGLNEIATRYGASLGVDAGARLGFGIGYSRSSAREGDGTSSGFSGNVEYELPVSGTRTCPKLGLGYGVSDGSNALRVRSYSTNLAFDVVVTTLEVGPVEVMPVVAPSYTLALLTFDEGAASSTWADAFALSATALLRHGRWWGSGGVAITETGDPSFGVAAGLLFR